MLRHGRQIKGKLGVVTDGNLVQAWFEALAPGARSSPQRALNLRRAGCKIARRGKENRDAREGRRDIADPFDFRGLQFARRGQDFA